jgi:hypothetical protein
MIVRSLDFKCEGVLNIYEFISYEKEKKSNKSCLNLSSCGWILHVHSFFRIFV